jgi:hypothetical protein
MNGEAFEEVERFKDKKLDPRILNIFVAEKIYNP